MYSILKREVRNYIKRPLFWIGIVVVIVMVFQNVSPYLNIHYLAEGEEVVNDYPEIFRDGDVFEGYVPTKKELRRQVWEEQILKTLIAEFKMTSTEAQSVISEMKEMDIMTACRHLDKYNFYGAYSVYVDTAYHKGTREEINSYIAEKLENKTFSYYFSRKFADFAGLFMGFLATVLLSALFMQDTRKNTYELLHTKPVSAGNYLSGKAGGGFAVCLIILAVLNLVFWILCRIFTKNYGFEVRLSDFISATCLYILPNMLMIVSVYSFISLLFKNPLPAAPLLFLYMVYSNMGSRNDKGVYGYYGRPLAIMVRFPGTFFDTAPPPMVLLNQSFLILTSAGILFYLHADMEKEAGILKQEIKISLPVYKIVFAVFFAIVLSLVRGVAYSFEIGIALEAPMAVLAACILADTYTQEITSKRSEIWRLYPVKKKMYCIYRRFVIQEIFLLSVAVLGYGLFLLFQNPKAIDIGQNNLRNEAGQFLIYLAAVAATLWFWGLLSNLLSCLFQNMWTGIGGCLILWLMTNSSAGNKYLGAWNLFSYTFRNVENNGDFSWIYGKIVCICMGIILAAILPEIIKKRG